MHIRLRVCESARSEDYKLRQRHYIYTHTHIYSFYDRTRCLIMAKRCCNVACSCVGGELAVAAAEVEVDSVQIWQHWQEVLIRATR